MKKMLLALFCIIILRTSNVYAEEVNALEMITNNYRTSFLDLTVWQQLGALGWGALGSAGTYLATKAVENILSSKPNEVNFWNLQEWSWAERGTVTIGTLWVTKYAGDQFKPEAVARKANENGLLNLLLDATTEDELQQALDEKFVTHHFPRAAAFAQLNELHANITHLLDITNKHNMYRPRHNFKTLQETLKSNLKRVNTALLLIKKDSRWHQECNAYAVNRIQAAQETQQQMELAGAVLQAAHAYSR